MNEGAIFDLWQGGLSTLALTAAPFLVVTLAVGLVTSIVQAATQLQENALSFVPKIVALGVALLLAGGWVLDRFDLYTEGAFKMLAEIGRRSGA